MKHRNLLAAALALVLCVALILCIPKGTPSPQPDPTDSTPSSTPATTPTQGVIRPAATASRCLYVQDNQLHYVSLSSFPTSITLGSNLYSEDISSQDYIQRNNASLDQVIRFSADGQKILYPQQMGYGGCDLYYQDLSNLMKEPILVASGLQLSESNLAVNETFDRITYLSSASLFQHDLNERKWISDQVQTFAASSDGTTLWYLRWDGLLCFVEIGHYNKTQQISTDVTEVLFYDEDTSLFFYLKDKDLYKQQGTEPEELIQSNVNKTVTVYPDGTAYYCVESQTKLCYLDLFEDDLADAEESAAYREKLQDLYLTSPFKTLYYYNGTESIELCDGMLSWGSLPDASAVTYTALESAELPAWKLSEYISAGENISTLWDQHRDTNASEYVAVKENTAKVEYGDMDNLSLELSANGTAPYLTVEQSDGSLALYRVTLEGCQITAAEPVDTNISNGALAVSCQQTADGTLIYFKDAQERTDATETENAGTTPRSYWAGALYMDGKLIDENVYAGSALYLSGKLYYLTDWNNVTNQGTLKLYDGETAQVIADGVYKILQNDNGDLLIRRNYNAETKLSELWIFSNGQLTQIAENVAELMDIYG